MKTAGRSRARKLPNSAKGRHGNKARPAAPRQSMIPGKEDWLLAELLLEPPKVFVLWAVATRLCMNPEDFRQQFGTGFPIDDFATHLKQKGFLREEAGVLLLTEKGKRAVSCLQEAEAKQGPRT